MLHSEVNMNLAQLSLLVDYSHEEESPSLQQYYNNLQPVLDKYTCAMDKIKIGT